ncbi:retrovirus-related pol polyprotein from transposon TNT 1-94 [Tanacetum coccineum]
MIMPSKDKMYNGKKGIGFENPSYFCKAKELKPSLYDERVIDLGYTLMFLTHSDEALEIKKFKRARENKIKFAYDYKNLNEKNIIIYLEDEVVSLLEKEKENLEIYESLKSKDSESSENAISKSENQSGNDCQVVEKGCDNLENLKVIAPGILYASYDVNDLFVFDDVSIRNSRVSKMPFRKKPRDSLNVHSKSNSNNSLPRTVFRWLPKMQPLAEPVAKWIPKIRLWIIDSGCSKHMTGTRALLTNFMETFLRTVRFGKNDFVVIAGYGDVVIGSMTIKKVYYVEGFGHNLFSVGQFCDKGLEVTFRKSTCFVRNEYGVDLLTGDRSSNLYTIALNEIASNLSACMDISKITRKQSKTGKHGHENQKSTKTIKKVYYVKDLLTDDRSSNLYTIALNKIASNSLACLLAKASSSQSWLWHQRLSHLNFATINNLMKNNLVRGLPKMKFEKDPLRSACEQGKIHRKHHKSKTAFASNKPFYLLHMDLCGPMRIKSINGKRYVLFVVDDYLQYTWVFFLHSKDKASKVIILFIKKTK